MKNSNLVSYTALSPNNSGKRTHKVDRITPHCVVGQISVEDLGAIFSHEDGASSNYGIGKDGRVAVYVNEDDRSWCSSSRENDQRAITIECASDASHPYAFNDTVYNRLIELCIDICKRYKKKKLIWFGDKEKSINYEPASNEMILTVHRWFDNKECPGEWLYSRLDDVANKVTSALSGKTPSKPNEPEKKDDSFLVRVTTPYLNIRKGPGTDYSTIGRFTGEGVFTIVETSKGTGSDSGWGKLKSGAGWIALDYATRV